MMVNNCSMIVNYSDILTLEIIGFFTALIYHGKLPQYFYNIGSREPLPKGKAQCNRPHCNNLFRLATLGIRNITSFLTKQSTLMRRSTVLRLPLKLVFPGTSLKIEAEKIVVVQE